jgi:hypothetical protein
VALSLKNTFYLAFCFLLTSVQTIEANQQNQQQQGGTAATPPAGVFGAAASLFQPQAMPNNIEASTQEANRLMEQQRQLQQGNAATAEGIVRQEREEPKNQKNVINTTTGTGGMRPTGRERDLTNLTDAEKVLSEEFIHDGLAQRTYNEACKGDNRTLCEGNDPSNRGMFIQMIARAYGMVVGVMGGKFTRRSGGEGETTTTTTTENGDNATTAKADDDKKEMNDYCRFIAIGTEAFAMFQQQFAQTNLSKLPHNADTAQRDKLLKAAVSHEERAKQAQFQTMGWGATAACYWSMLAFAQLDWQLGLKIGGSTLIAGFFHNEIQRQKGYASKIRSLADQMPGKGDCNPITERICYCSQPETMNDATFCVNEMRRRHINETAYMNTTCIDGQMRADPECRCLDSESCFDKRIESSLRGVGFGNLQMQGIRPIQEMSRGSVTAGTFNGAGRQVAALNNRLDRSPEIKKLLESREVQPAQREGIDVLAGSGVSPTLSKLMAFAPPNAATAENIARFQDASASPEESLGSEVARSVHGGNARFSGGFGLQDRYGSNDDGYHNPAADIFKRLNQGNDGDRAPADNVLRFAERAEQNAQITRRPDTPIFEIISNRYRLSAWTRLPMDIPDEDTAE